MPERGGVGLRTRLTAFFLAITVLPLVVAVVVLHLQLRHELRQQAADELAALQEAAVALLGAERARAADVATDLADALATDPLGVALGDPDAAQAAAEFLAGREQRLTPDRADLVAVLGAEGELLARAGRDPRFAAADAEVVDAATDPQLLEAAVRGQGVVPGALVEVRELTGPGGEGPLGRVAALVWTDDALLEDLGLSGTVALVAGEQVLGVSGVDPDDVPTERPLAPGEVVLARWGGREVVVASAPLLDGGGPEATELLAWAAPGQGLPPAALLPLIGVPALLAAVLGAVLASTVVEPLRDAADVARAVAAGDLSRRLEPTGGREIADLSRALNTMGEQLRVRMAELGAREEQLRGSLERLGEMLSSSLDLERTVSVVLDTALEAVGADTGLLTLLPTAAGGAGATATRGLDAPPPLRPGEGALGAVLQSGDPVVLPAPGTPTGPQATPAAALGASGAPGAPVQLVVPLRGPRRVLGVLALYRQAPDRPFAEADTATVATLATQAAVAIENVLLHREARRLAVTDPLTGLWNFRHFQIEAEREVQRSGRSGHPLSLIVADIDRFKDINDRHGHQVGDAVLVEVALRLQAATRTPDLVARYGGEEFVVLLPDTDTAGAAATAERIRASVGSVPVEPLLPGEAAGPGPLPVTCSVGVAALPARDGTVAGLVRAADAAMYEAKQRGRDRVVVADG